MAIPPAPCLMPAVRRQLVRCALAGALVAGWGAPAVAQLADGGFVPALAPHTVRQPPLLSAGYAAGDGGSGVIARGDVWFGRLGAAVGAGAAGARPGAAGGERQASLVALLEVVTQGVGVFRPGVQLQGAVTGYEAGGDARWSVPVSLGVLLNAPIPLPNRAHVQVHPSLSLRHVVAASGSADGPSADGTSGGLGLRAVFTDRAGGLTLWGAHGYVRLVSRREDRGPRWEVALTRVLGRSASPDG